MRHHHPYSSVGVERRDKLLELAWREVKKSDFVDKLRDELCDEERIRQVLTEDKDVSMSYDEA